MLYRVYGPIAAAPSLHLALQHIARTPAARLSIVYEIAARCPPAVLVQECAVRHCAALPPAEVAEILADRALRGPFQQPFNLGNRLYLDSLLAGGIDGQQLPMSICRCDQAYLANECVGAVTDILA